MNPITVIWQEGINSDQIKGICEEDYLKHIFSHLPRVHHVYDLNEKNEGKYEDVCDRAVIVYSGDRNKEKVKKISEYLKKFKGKKCVLIHLSDERLKAKDSFYRNVSLVLRNYHKTYFFKRNVKSFPLGCTQGKVPPSGFPFKPMKDRKYTWSFAGEISRHKPHRYEILEVLKDVKEYFTFVTDDFGKSIHGALGPKEYCDLMNDSVFVPCPRGNRSLDCFRDYEAAMYGAIPVVVGPAKEIKKTFGSFHAPFLYASSWKEAKVKMHSLLEKPEELQRMSDALIAWSKAYAKEVAQIIEQTLTE